MKRATLTLAAILIATTTLLTTTTPATAARCGKDCRARQLLIQDDPTWRAISQKEIGKLARNICALFDTGLDHLTLLDFIENAGLTEDMSIALIATSTVVYCPRHNL